MPFYTPCCDKSVTGRNHSVHEENGFYFTVTEDLFKKVENFVLNNNT